MTPFSIFWNSVIPLPGFNNWILKDKKESKKKKKHDLVRNKKQKTIASKSNEMNNNNNENSINNNNQCTTTKTAISSASSSSIVLCLSTMAVVLLLTMLQGTDGSPVTSFQQELFNSQKSKLSHQSFNGDILKKSSRPKFSSKIPSQTYKRAANPFQPSVPPPNAPSSVVLPVRRDIDFSHGFPNGFTQGLPAFDFSKPMTSTKYGGEKNENGEPIGEDTNNVGFVHGPPKGFPTLEQLGGNFPDFGNNNDKRTTRNKPANGQFQLQAQSSSTYKQQQQIEDDGDDYLSGPGPVSMYNPPIPIVGRRPPPLPPHIKHGYKHGFIRGPIIATATTRVKPHQIKPSALGIYPKRPTKDSAKMKYYNLKQTSKPIFVQMSNKKVKQAIKLPPLPPVFYAPSPDHVHPASSQQVNQYATMHPRHIRSTAEIKVSEDKNKTVNSTSKTDKKLSNNGGDLVADGDEQHDYWELPSGSSPYILFDTYNPHHSHEVVMSPRNDDISAASDSDNVTVHDDAISGEQRFFPSFPAPSPYLGLGVPFLPQPRPPLFPGPTANRAPSRYYPQFGPGKYTPSLVPPTNRGPNNVFSAESHDQYQDNNLLGSGNFEVVRGGTYYQDDDHGGDYFHPGLTGHDDGDYYQHHHNAHAPPQGYRVPGQDFFANFRDFADINPPSRSYSHNHETKIEHSAAASTVSDQTQPPKNILEKLESTSETVFPPGHHEFSSSSETDPMLATF